MPNDNHELPNLVSRALSRKSFTPFLGAGASMLVNPTATTAGTTLPTNYPGFSPN